MESIISIVQTADGEKEAMTYIAKKYMEYFGTSPGKSDIYLTAENNKKIIGTIALDFADASGMMPLEKIYTINRNKIPLPLTTENGAQFGRWISDNAAVSLALVYAAVRYSIKIGKDYGWLAHSDAVHRILTRQNVAFYLIQNADLILENVPEGDRLFYTTPPYAKCYIMRLDQAQCALEPKIKGYLDSQRIVFKP